MVTELRKCIEAQTDGRILYVIKKHCRVSRILNQNRIGSGV